MSLEDDDKRLETLRAYRAPQPYNPYHVANDIAFLIRVIDTLNANIDAYEADGEVKS